MSKRRSSSRAAWWRRGVQLAFLTGFIALLILARPVPGEAPSVWLQLYFALDPLILLVTFIAAHAVPLLLLYAFVTVVVTLVQIGRAHV